MKSSIFTLFLICMVLGLKAQDFTKLNIPIVPFGGLIVGDFDGDGFDDFGGLDYGNPSSIEIYHSLGTLPMTFETIAIKPDFDAKGKPAVADFNGDGKLDIAVAKGSSFDLFLLMNEGIDNFTETPLNVAGSARLYVADMEGDGDLDIVGLDPNLGNVNLYTNDGNLNFSPSSLATDLNDLEDIAIGDIDGDGDIEIVFLFYTPFGDGESVVLQNNNGDNSFTPIVISQDDIKRNNEVELGDFNKDGKLDIGVAGRDAFYGFINDGGLSFHKEELIPYTGTSIFGFISSHLVDINNDGAPDAVFGETEGPTTWYKNISIAPLTYEKRTVGPGTPAYEFVHGDFDGDGDRDLVVSNGELHVHENLVEQLSEVKENPDKASLVLYPNPANNLVYLSSAGAALTNSQYQLFDTHGKLVKAGSLNSNQLDVSGFSSGVYLLKMVDSLTGSAINSKLVKI